MKRFSLLLLLSLMLTGCGVGVYSVSSGKSDSAKMTFVDDSSYDIIVKIDNVEHATQTVRVKNYKSGMNIKKTAIKAIDVSTGNHKIEVLSQGKTIYSRSIFISANEHKIIEL